MIYLEKIMLLFCAFTVPLWRIHSANVVYNYILCGNLFCYIIKALVTAAVCYVIYNIVVILIMGKLFIQILLSTL